MKRTAALLGLILILLTMPGCEPEAPVAQVAATTLPVYDFTVYLCRGTDISVTRIVTESVSCLHDYSLSVRQVKAVEGAQAVVLSGAGLEEFMADVLHGCGTVIDSAADIDLLTCEDGHGQAHEYSHEHGHHHEYDPHIWLSPEYAKRMARNICAGLKVQFPACADIMENNLTSLLAELDALQQYGDEQLANLSSRELITFHDGFAYFADAFGLTILEAVEEESGSEASAAQLKHLIGLVEDHGLSAVFTEKSGSASAAGVIAAETGAAVFELDMAMSGSSYFDAMYHNIDTIKEALG